MMAMTTKSSMSVKALFRVGWAHFRFMVFEIEFGELGLTLYDFNLHGKSRDWRFQQAGPNGARVGSMGATRVVCRDAPRLPCFASLKVGRSLNLTLSLFLLMNFQIPRFVWAMVLMYFSLAHANGTVLNRFDEYANLGARQKGVLLINELGCVSCHASSQSHFKPRTGPDLSGLGSRIKPEWLTEFLKAPHGGLFGPSLPNLPHQIEGAEKWSRSEIENALAHFLLADESPKPTQVSVGKGSDSNGETLFHTIGCGACHGATDTEEGSKWLRYVREKYQPNALYAFLLDPLETRPGARMPDMHLSHTEALDLTAFFMLGAESVHGRVLESLSDQAAWGHELFGQLRCNACHQQEGQISKASLPTLETLRLNQGCLSDEKGTWPSYEWGDNQRSWIKSALKSETQWTPSERVQMQLMQFNCLVCHERDGIGGVSQELDTNFTSTDPNLGEQGRLPPRLDGVGAKLNPTWLRKILVQGESSRPYMKTRMPRFGAGVLDELLELLITADSQLSVPEIEMPNFNDTQRAGRDLAGTKGMACITCHAFKGTQSGAMAAVDMALMGQRLTREWFHHYMTEPQRFSPGTLMPDFWPGGHSTKPEILDGKIQKQIEALWVYLSDGYSLGNPAGLHREPMRLVSDEKEAVMLRRAYPGIGKRGIGVGLPHGLNYVFHAEQLCVSLLWRGEFADPAGVWMSQGHGSVRPLARRQIRFPNQPQWQLLNTDDAPWFVSEKRPLGQAFKGYRLDAQRRPTFLYQVDGVRIEDAIKEIEKDGEWVLRRDVLIDFEGATKDLMFRAAVAETIQPLTPVQYQVGDGLKISLVHGGEFILTKGTDGDELRVNIEHDSHVKRLTLHYLF